MVNFDNETTITRPAIDIIRVLVLEKREDCISAGKGYHKVALEGASCSDSEFRSRLWALYSELRSSLKRHYPKDYEVMKENILRGEEEDLFNTFDKINEFLDMIKLTRLDTQKVYDSTRVEIENTEKSL